MATSDALIAAATAGDEDAFREIVERHERVVRGFIVGLVADLDSVDELVRIDDVAGSVELNVTM